jgi:molybdopterin/thiamine biosynthesis adenylyltransferase/rhodanese-related sulfurtransferase
VTHEDQQTYHELVDALRPQITETSTGDLEARLSRAVVVDIREAPEYEQGAIPGARFIPRGVLEANVTDQTPDRAAEIVLYCATGHRSVLAANSLQMLGYSNVSSLAGGFEQWKAEQRAWEVPSTLSNDQRARYSRHLMLTEVGEEGQQRLLESKALIVGAGGLGSPVALYLAAAGVGTIGIVDFDLVDGTNLQRQILHDVGRIGSLKAESARETIRSLNPDVHVNTYPTRLSAENALDIMTGYDVIVDGADNFPTRYLVNDASLHLRVPVVHGSIFRFEGQATVFDPYNGPCYRCLFSEPPPPELAPSCAEAGVLGVLPGVVGSIQATEALKILLGVGETLTGRLLLYDALDEDFRTVNLHRNPECPACADEEHPPRIVEYDQSCTPAGSVARS